MAFQFLAIFVDYITTGHIEFSVGVIIIIVKLKIFSKRLCVYSR